MQRRTFGDSGLEVSTIGLDGSIFARTAWADRPQDDCDRLLSFAFERGITFFDIGDVSGSDRSADVLGRWIRSGGVRRDGIEVAGRFDFGAAGDGQAVPLALVRDALERLLKRLQTDTLDLFMAQDIKLPQFRDDLIAECDKLRDAGRIRAWGVSLGPGIGWREEGIEAMIRYKAPAVQTVFNLFEQDPGREFCQVARACRAGVIARGHDAGGVLKDGAVSEYSGCDRNWVVQNQRKVEKIRPIAAAHGMSIHQLACKWLLMQPGLSAITATLLTQHEIAEACDAANMPDLSRDALHTLTEAYADDFGLGESAHPRDLGSSTSPTGKVRSTYVPPPVLIA